MLKTRLWMGSILIGLALLVLTEGWFAAPAYPFLFLFTLGAAVLGTEELRRLLPAADRPRAWVVFPLVAACVLVHWLTLAWSDALLGLVAAGCVVSLAVEIARFRGPGGIVPRVSHTLFAVVLLGVLPGSLVRIRMMEPDALRGALMLAATIFVPKFNDIGAYFTGRFLTGRVLGRTPFMPLLSPKKTWQGAVGGMLMSVVTALVLRDFGLFPHGPLEAVGFGLAVGIAGILGDLAESLIKRDCGRKDASSTIPGFGGVLDVIDSLLFAAPVAWLWFTLSR